MSVCVCRPMSMTQLCVSCSLFSTWSDVSWTLPSLVVSNRSLPCQQHWLPMTTMANLSRRSQTMLASQSIQWHSLWTMHASLATVVVTWSSSFCTSVRCSCCLQQCNLLALRWKQENWRRRALWKTVRCRCWLYNRHYISCFKNIWEWLGEQMYRC